MGCDQRANIRTGVIKLDPWLAPFSDSLKRRYSKAQEWIKTIQDTEGGLDKFSKASFGWKPLKRVANKILGG